MHYSIFNKHYNVLVHETTFILTGGAGNQLFGIYAGLYYQNSLSARVNFVYESSGNYSSLSSILETLEFTPTLKFSSEPTTHSTILGKSNNYFRNKIKIYNKLLNIHNRKYLSPVLSFDSNLLEAKNAKSIYGYFQTAFYYDKVTELGFVNPKLINPSKWYEKNVVKIKVDSPIVMHVRRGDYLNHSRIFQVLDRDYYLNAINTLPGDLIRNPIWIFSDDEIIAQELIKYLPDRNYVVIDQIDQKPIEVLLLMSAGVAHITANSTFSWWSAKLSSSSIHIVAPKTWFKDRPTPKDLLPKNWRYI
jgi:hypothetical protein